MISANETLSPIQRFNRLLQLDSKDITQVYVYALFNGLVNLSLPLGIQAIINLIQGGRMTTSWIILVCIVITGIALTGVFQLLQLRIVENLAQKIFSRASFEFAYRIPRIKQSALYNYYAPELANRFFDTMTIQKGLPKILIGFSLALFQIVVGLIVLSLYHSFFILFSLLLVGLVYIIIALTGPQGLRTSLNESNNKYRIAFWLEEIARTKLSFKLLSDSNMHLTQNDRYVEKYLTAREAHFRVLVAQFLYLIGFKVVVAAGLLITGSILVFRQEMNIGQFVAAEIIIILIIASVEKLIRSLDSIYDVLTALEKIGYVTDMPMDNDTGLTLKRDGEPLSISVQNVSYQYPNTANQALKALTLDIPGGESVFIEGPSSSGKSTFLHMLAGILEPDSGIIRYNGFPLKSINGQDLRKRIGYVLNKNDIFQGSILDNIMVGRDAVTPENIRRAIRITQLEDFVATVPLGLNTILDPEGNKVPRNIKERILLARAIASDPDLLILESPLDHVASEEKEEIIRDLMNPGNKWKVIVTSVDPVWKKYIPRSIVISKGSVKEIYKTQGHAEHQ